MAISGCAIGSAVVLAGIVARVVADPSTRHLGRWLGPLAILLALWAIRALTHWLQARLGQRGASAVIADLSGQVLTAVTGRQPRQVAAQRDAAAVLVTRGLDGLRPYFTGYLPALLLAVILTPATVAVIAAYDMKSTAIVVITLPLIPIFMVLIGLATADRSTAALAAMGTLQARLLDLIAGIPTLRALGRAVGRSSASQNSLPRTAVRRWPRCGSPSCRRWCSNCWPRWAWPWSRSASVFAWYSVR
ncbi:ABC transporter transmembrane region family protein [Mycobacterium kansasii]|uniref:ABC transporter transmembrane region family protein n=1 Tax=Mycobacterium kansasii TaxID=1768 RepID=A0A1V3WHI8_MYCKA|nr:ABC transporter transmembrane region family protein [Mycobacterium kansasii]